MNPNIPEFLQTNHIQLLLFGGKGGVGKTTCAAATALYFAQNSPQERFLLVSTDPAHSLRDSIANEHLPDNLQMEELDSQSCLDAFKQQHQDKLRQIALRGTFLDADDIGRFLELSLPGMDELMAFWEISRWVEQNKYLCIFVDTAPAGHTMRLLQMPELLRKWLKVLDTLLAKHRYMVKLYRGAYQLDEIDNFLLEMAESLKRMDTLLGDACRCAFVTVMLAEPVVIQETIGLLEELGKLSIPSREIVVNRLHPDNGCPACKSMRHQELQELAIFQKAFVGRSMWQVPLYAQETRGLQMLQHFWQETQPWQWSTPTVPPVCLAQDLYVENPSDLPSADTKLLLFAGKGGVGKTTLSCATAVQLAQKLHKKVLLFSTDPAHTLSECLEVKVGAVPMEIAPGLIAYEINAQKKFADLKELYIEEVERFLGNLLPDFELAFDQEAIKKIMDLAPPGLDEVMALTEVMKFLTQNDYDILILDSAPTGHLLRLLELPGILDDWLKVFFQILLKYKNMLRLPKVSQLLVSMSQNLKYMKKLLADPRHSAIYAVSILNEMAWEETKDLVASCKRMGIYLPKIFLNLATPKRECPLCAAIQAREQVVRAKFSQAFANKKLTLVYRQSSEPCGLARLAALGQILYRANR